MRSEVTHRCALRAMLVGLTLLLMPALLACANVERTVVDVGLVTEGEDDVRTLTWDSGRYPPHVERDPSSECLGEASEGRPVPDACLTALALAQDTDPFRASPGIAWAGVALAIALLLLVAWKVVGWRPEVARTTAGEPTPTHFDEAAAVALMRNSERERSARIEGERHHRKASRPFLLGVLAVLAVLVPLVLLVGYGRALGWSLRTGLILFFVLGPLIAALQLNFLRPPNLDVAFERAAFASGAIATLLFGSLVALYFRAPLVSLNGVDWPF